MKTRVLQSLQDSPEYGANSLYEMKIRHLSEMNNSIYKENLSLKEQLKCQQKLFRNIMKQESPILKNHKSNQSNLYESTRCINKVLHQKNLLLEKKIEELLRQNQLKTTQAFLNEQIQKQRKKQYRLYLQRYQQKIVDLRISLAMKQAQIQNLQLKEQKYRGIIMPFSKKNNNRYIEQILKYEELIGQLIEEKSKRSNSINCDAYEIGSFLKGLHTVNNKKEHESSMLRNCKSPGKVVPSNLNLEGKTEGKSKLGVFDQVNPRLSSREDIVTYFETTFLKLHLQIKTLRSNITQKNDKLNEYKVKDKIMKQGYHTITKQLQKVRNQNCQLKIQMEHMQKKEKQNSGKLNRAKSVGNFKGLLAVNSNRHQTHHKIQSLLPNIPSQISIDQHLGNNKVEHNQTQCKALKVTIESETRHQSTKSHTFDEITENVDQKAYIDSPFKITTKQATRKNRLMNQKFKQKVQDQDQDSNNQQKSEDLSISLDVSGLIEPQRTDFERSKNMIEGFDDIF